MKERDKNSRIALGQIRESTINYLYQKQQQEDWHAVADAAMDLREIDAKLEIINELDKSGSRGVSGSGNAG